jgi:uncharacterized membrane protein YtjA (UPF0391 family)
MFSSAVLVSLCASVMGYGGICAAQRREWKSVVAYGVAAMLLVGLCYLVAGSLHRSQDPLDWINQPDP